MSHPPLDTLKAFINGNLAAEQIEDIALHLEQCPHCLSQIDALDHHAANDDPLSQALRHCGSLPETFGLRWHGKKIGRYTLLEELGRGGMGVVYRAYDEQLHRDVALKVIPTGVYADPEQRLRLRQEAETIAALQHPGIVQIYDVGEHKDTMYIALELLYPGGLEVISRRRQCSPTWCAAVIQQIAESLDYAHQAGFVHRDIKPDNILLAPSEAQVWPMRQIFAHPASDNPTVPQMKISDFGLSKNLEDESVLTHAGVMLGTPDYMAPEQIPDSGETVGVAADIYALGAILYELLTGKPPLQAEKIADQLTQLREHEPHSPQQDNPKIPPDLATICLKCLRKKPEQRYVSAHALAQDLARFLKQEPIQARPLSPWQKLLIWARRTPILATHLTAILFLYVMHLFAMWVLQEPSHLGIGHWRISFVVMVWFGLVLGTEWIYRQTRWRVLGEYLYAFIGVSLLQVENIVNIGPPYHFPAFMPLTILVALLIRFDLSMIRFATLAALISFNTFAVISNSLERIPYSAERILLFNLMLMFTGLVLYLLLRRMSHSQ